MFAGLRSRCVMPFWCAADMASATAIPIVSTRSSGRPPERQHLGQRSPFHQLHRQEDGRAGVFDRMDGDDVRVVERRDGERLARESLAAIGIGGGDVGQDLQRDIALEPRIARAVHLAHPARAERAQRFRTRRDGCRRQA